MKLNRKSLNRLAAFSLTLATVPFVHADDSAKLYVSAPQALTFTYKGTERALGLLKSGQSAPISLTAGDFDGDGIHDLAAGYATSSGGLLVFHRGNLDAFSPQNQKSLEAVGRGEYPSPLMTGAQVLELPVRPDFLAAGHFAEQNGTDILVAARGGSAIYRISKSANGKFEINESVNVAGKISALAVFQLDTQSAYGQALVGVHGENGPQLQILTGTSNGLTSKQSIALVADAKTFAAGNLDGDTIPDVAILAGYSIYILHGRDLGSDATSPQVISLPFAAAQIAIGTFITGRDSRLQLAALDAKGSVHFLVHEGFDATPYTPEEFRALRQARAEGTELTSKKLSDRWIELDNVGATAPFDPSGQSPLMFQSRVSGFPADDVVVIDAVFGRIAAIAHRTGDPTAILLARPEAVSNVVAAISARVNIDGRPGLLLLGTSQDGPSAMMPLPDPTFYVNRFDDPAPRALNVTCQNGLGFDGSNDCSLREAIRRANSASGPDTIMLQAGTYQLTIPKVANDYTAASGALDVTDSLTISGVGQNATFIQAGTTNSDGVDKVFSFNQDITTLTDATVSLSNLTIRYGHNRGTAAIHDGYGGAFDFDTGASGNATLTLTNVTVSDSTTTDGDGGGIAIFNTLNGSGGATLTNSIVQNNGAVRNTGSLAGNGGGILVTFPGKLILNNTQVSNNTATQNTGSGKGVGGGLYLTGSGSTQSQIVIHGSTISGNQSAGDGGGIWSNTGLLIDTQSVISGNSAVGNGGGLWYNATPPNAATLSKVTIVNNTANGNGGGIRVENSGSPANLGMTYSRIAGNTAAAGQGVYNNISTITVADNWWGTNTPANVITSNGGLTTYTPYITFTHVAASNQIQSSQSTTLTASLAQDSNGSSGPLAGNLNVLSGLPITFGNASLGTITQAQPESLSSGAQATATFVAGTIGGQGHVDATVDGQTITVNIAVTAGLVITKSFNPTTIAINGTSTVTFMINNPNVVATDANFTDSLPSGMVVAATPSVSNSCGGTVTATAGASSIGFTNSALAVGACSITVSVKGTTDGVKNNSVTIGSTAAGTGNTSSASLTVINPPSIAGAFGASSIALGTSTTLTFTITTTNSSLTLNGISFTDSLPSGLVVASTPNLTSTCSGTATATAGSSTVSLSGGSLAPPSGSTCTVSVKVTGSTAGVKSNSVSVSSTNGLAGNTSNASLTVVAPATIATTFGAASIPLNGSTSISFTITNPSSTASLSGLSFSNTLPAGLVISTPNGLSGVCGGGTITATQGTSLISLSGATLAATASCTFSLNVTGIAAGAQSNVTTAIASTEGGTGLTASANIAVEAPPIIAKSFTPATIALNATSFLGFTITNPAANTLALTGVAFSDTLQAGMTVVNASFTVCGGTLSITGANTIALSGATIAVNGTCTFNLSVTGAAAGAYNNTTGNVSSTNGGTGNTASSTLTVAAPPTITGVFGVSSIPLNTSTSLTFTITAPATNPIALTGIAFTDALPAGLVVATPNALNSTCGGASSAVAGTSTVSLSGATLAANASCVLSINVTGSTAGNKNNSVSVTSAEGSTGNTSSATLAVVAPPTLGAVFGASSVPLTGATSLSFTITNPSATASLSGIGFTDTLPAGLTISTPNGLTGSCGGGTITASQGTSVISLSGASLASSASCTFAVNVTGNTAGAYSNTTGTINSVEGGTGLTASTNLAVEAPPSIAKSFTPTTIALNGTSTLAFTITNPAANTLPLTGVTFTDTLQAGMSVVNNTSSTCGGTLALTGGNTISLTGATIAVASNCTFNVIVTGTAAGNYPNTTGSVGSSNGGAGNTAASTLTVAGPPSIVSSFGAPSISTTNFTSLTFTITAPAGNTISLTGIAFTDTLPAGLVVSTPNAFNSTCGGTSSAVAGSSSVTLSAATLAPGASCTISLNVTGNTGGIKNNSVAVTSTEGGNGNTSNISMIVVGPPTISTVFGASSIPLTGTTSLTFNINNVNTTAALSGVAVSDTLPAGLVVATPNGQTGSCGSGVITAVSGTNVISLTGGTLPISTACTFSINVTGVAAGTQNNVTGAVSSTEGNTGSTASSSIAVEAPPSIAKAFTPATISLNATSSLSFTITNPAANVLALTGVNFSDVLQAGMSVTNNTASTCGGTLTISGGNTISLAGATIAVGGNCTFNVTVTGTAAGSYLNNTGNVGSTNGGTGNTASATLTVAAPPTITGAFGTSSISTTSSTSLTFTISAPAGNTIALTGIAFTDTLPAGLVVATPNALNSTCTGTATATAGASSVTLSAATLAPGATCTISLNVTGTTGGVKNNSVLVTSTEGGNGNTSNASLTVVGPPTFSTVFGAASIPLNGSTSLTFSINNPNSVASLSGIAVSDTLPTGLVVATPNGQTGVCGGGTIAAVAGTNTISLSGATLAASATCTFSINVTGIAAGTQGNTTGAITSAEGSTGLTASASIAVEAPPSIAKAYTPATISLNATSSLGFTITNPAANVLALSGVTFTDVLQAGLTIPNGSSAMCGGTLTTSGGNTITLTGASIATGGNCSFSVTVTGVAAGSFPNLTGSVTSSNGGTGNTATSTVTVVAPPTITTAFGTNSISTTTSTSLTFTITAPTGNTIPLTGIAFSDTLPAGLIVASNNALNNTCGGTGTAAAGSSSVTLSGATLAPGASCILSISVTGTTGGVKNNSVLVTSIEGGNGNTATASMTVVGPPTIAAAFGAPSVPLNGSTTFTFNINNVNTTASLSGIAFSNTLPAGLVVSTPNGLTGTCGGGSITSAQGTSGIALSGATLAAGTSCTFSVNVTGTVAGAYVTTTTAITTVEGGTGLTASASLAVVAPPTMAKAFSPTTIAVGDSTTLTYTIVNPAANTVALAGVAFTDNLAAALTVASGSNSVCGGTLTTSGSTISLSGASIAINSNCVFSVPVTGAGAGGFTSVSGAVSATNGGTGNTATASLSVATPPVIATAFGAAGIPLNGVTTALFAIANPNNVPLNGVQFGDSLPAGMLIASPAGAASTCGGTLIAVPGTTVISLTGGSLPLSSSCAISVNVTSAAPGTLTNITGIIAANESGSGTTSGIAILAVVAPPSIDQAFGPTSIQVNGTSTLTFTLTNPSVNTIAEAGVAFSNTFPAGMTVADPSNVVNTCGGTFTAKTLSGSVSLTGGIIPSSGSCTISLSVTAISGGDRANTTGNVTSTNGGTGNTATATLSVQVPVTVNTAPGGVGFSVDGTAYTASQDFLWAVGSSHTLSTTAQQAMGTDTLNVWTNWSDSGALSHTIVVTATPTTYTANFNQQYLLATSAAPRGSGSVDPLPTLFASGLDIRVTATPAKCFAFGSWSGNVASSTSASTTVHMSGPQNVIANFVPVASCSARPTLTLITSPTAGGTITATPGPDASGTFDPGANVQVQVQTNPGYLFIGFSPDLSGSATSQTVVMNGNKTVTANFAPVPSNPQDFDFGFLRGGALPATQSAAFAGSLLGIAPLTGGNWLQATINSNDPQKLVLGLNGSVVNTLSPGTYTTYVTTGSAAIPTVFQVRLLVDALQINQVVDSAGYRPQILSSEGLSTVFGINLSTQSLLAPSLPLTDSLGGTQVTITDSQGITRPALLVYVSPGQINFVSPAGMANGTAVLTITNSTGLSGTLPAQVRNVAPGLFSANASGSGMAAAVVLKVAADGTRTSYLAADCTTTPGTCTGVPIDLGAATDSVYVSLYGSGLRGRTSMNNVTITVGGVAVTTQYVGSQPQYPGLDQVNILLPHSLAGKGNVNVATTIDGLTANVVRLSIR